MVDPSVMQIKMPPHGHRTRELPVIAHTKDTTTRESSYERDIGD